eukprot:COSAG01_NODE_228_length_21104_cov_210.303832_5_plen_240_part_00
MRPGSRCVDASIAPSLRGPSAAQPYLPAPSALLLFTRAPARASMCVVGPAWGIGVAQRWVERRDLSRTCAKRYEDALRDGSGGSGGAARAAASPPQAGVTATYGPGLAPLEFGTLTGLIARRQRGQQLPPARPSPPINTTSCTVHLDKGEAHENRGVAAMLPLGGSTPAVPLPPTAAVGAAVYAAEEEPGASSSVRGDPDAAADAVGAPAPLPGVPPAATAVRTQPRMLPELQVQKLPK